MEEHLTPSEPATDTSRDSVHAMPPKKEEGSFWELLRYATLALIIVIPIRIFIAQPFVVSGDSMVPTFENGNYLIVDEISYRLKEPERGEVVVFRYPYDTTKFFIKRVIGLPGETVAINGNEITITNDERPEGFELDEPYVFRTARNTMTITLSDTEYFVMGDNRSGSSDSRAWGPLEERFIVGRAFMRLLPVTRAALFPGSIEKFDVTEESYR